MIGDAGRNRARLAVAVAGAVGLLAFAGQVEAGAEPPCGPFESSPLAISETTPAVPLREPGITSTRADGSAALEGAGGIARIPAAPEASARAAAEPGEVRPSEALLALPKDASGAIPGDFELGPGVRIARSFFSPVLCSTVARVVGPAGASLRELVPGLPDASIVVANDVYFNAAASAAEDPTPLWDPYDRWQYGLEASGVRRARSLSDGSGVRIALLDSAPDVAHRDLGPVEMRVLPGAGPGEVQPGLHGTLMAGVIVAREHNGFGIAGLAPGAQLVSIPVCASDGQSAGGRCTLYDLLRGFDRAWEIEAQIVNLSLTGPANPLLARGVARLEDLGLVVVAAAGNEGLDEPRYPAAYPSVVGVGAVDRDGAPFVRGNRGAWVELVAPGVEVISTVPGDSFAFGDGTSLAAAHVTGILAVLTGVTKDARLARAELFRTLHASGSQGLPARVPSVCAVLPRLDRACADEAVAAPLPRR